MKTIIITLTTILFLFLSASEAQGHRGSGRRGSPENQNKTTQVK